MYREQEDEILRLQEKLDGENQMKMELGKWNARYTETAEQARELDAECRRLQEEIGQLQGRSLKALAYRLLFKRKKALNIKREEEAQLAEQFEEARSRQKEQEEKIRFYENELFKLKGVKRRLEQLEKERIEDYKNRTGTQDEDFLCLEKEIQATREEANRFQEVLHSARAAYEVAGEVMRYIDGAEQSGRLDLYGGGFWATLDKHEHLNMAQSRLEDLQIQVSHFKGELADISLPEDIQINVDGFLKFADYFFDGAVSDFLVIRRIKKISVPVMQFRRKMEGILEGMEARLAVMEAECTRKEKLLHQKLLR